MLQTLVSEQEEEGTLKMYSTEHYGVIVNVLVHSQQLFDSIWHSRANIFTRFKYNFSLVEDEKKNNCPGMARSLENFITENISTDRFLYYKVLINFHFGQFL